MISLRDGAQSRGDRARGRDHFGVFRQFHEIGVRFDESAHRVVDDVSGSLMKHCMVQSS